MTQTITVNSVDQSGVIQRQNVEWAESAYLGEVAEGKIQIDDAAGTIVVPGFKDITVEQDASTPSRIFSGFSHRKGIRRGSTYSVGASREYQVGTLDGNDLLRRHIIRQRSGDTAAEGGKRLAETVGDRVTWLLASGFLDASDFGAVTYPSGIGMDADNYKGRYAIDVLQACAKAVSFNFYIRWNVAEAAWELVFRDDNASTADTCTLSISNVGADVNGTTVFPPFQETELSEDPERVYSGMYGTYTHGTVYETRAATATAFADRDGVSEDAGDKDEATSSRNAVTNLWAAHTEEQLLPVTIRLPAAKVGLVQAGMRISTRMTHMAPEGWDPAAYGRILRLRRTQPKNDDNTYDVALELSPQEAGPPAAAIVQSAFGYISLGAGTLSLPNPVTIGNLLVFVISARSTPTPSSPNITTSHPRWGAGAWTKDPNTTVRYGAGSGGGVAIWYKTADAVDQTGYVPVTESLIGIYEIAGGDIGSATTTYETLQSAANPMTIGSLGTAADGSVAILVGNWNDSSLVPPTDPTWTGTANGWVLDRIQTVPGVYPRWGPPVSYCAHALGDGSSLTASGTRGGLYFMDGKWCGAAILIPPA